MTLKLSEQQQAVFHVVDAKDDQVLFNAFKVAVWNYTNVTAKAFKK